MSHCMTLLIIDNGVCRTALDTPGLPNTEILASDLEAKVKCR